MTDISDLREMKPRITVFGVGVTLVGQGTQQPVLGCVVTAFQGCDMGQQRRRKA